MTNTHCHRHQGSGVLTRVLGNVTEATPQAEGGALLSILAVLSWFGATNWTEFHSWLIQQGILSASPSSPSRVVPTPTPDPGCTEYLHVLTSFNASQHGAPNQIAAGQAHRVALERYSFADDLDRAAADARQSSVREAITTYAEDMRTLASDIDAKDPDAMSSESSQVDVDGHSVTTACENPVYVNGG